MKILLDFYTQGEGYLESLTSEYARSGMLTQAEQQQDKGTYLCVIYIVTLLELSKLKHTPPIFQVDDINQICIEILIQIRISTEYSVILCCLYIKLGNSSAVLN